MASISLSSNRKALEVFKEQHPEIQSALQIAAMTREEFLAAFEADIKEKMEGDRSLAIKIHQEAILIREKATLLWANIKDTVASPFFRNTLTNNIPQEFFDHQEAIPGFDKLFGNLDFVECDHCRSVFGPAAYLVDILRFVDEHITKNADNSILPELKLEVRRPDLHLIHNWIATIPTHLSLMWIWSMKSSKRWSERIKKLTLISC